MRQFPLTQCIYNWIQQDYVSEINSYKCKKGLLYDVIIAGLDNSRPTQPSFKGEKNSVERSPSNAYVKELELPSDENGFPSNFASNC